MQYLNVATFRKTKSNSWLEHTFLDVVATCEVRLVQRDIRVNHSAFAIGLSKACNDAEVRSYYLQSWLLTSKLLTTPDPAPHEPHEVFPFA